MLLAKKKEIGVLAFRFPNAQTRDLNMQGGLRLGAGTGTGTVLNRPERPFRATGTAGYLKLQNHLTAQAPTLAPAPAPTSLYSTVAVSG